MLFLKFGLPVLLAAMGVFLAGCTASQAPKTEETADTSSFPVWSDNVAEVLKQKQALTCEPGKEWWRALGQPKRGGTFVASTRFMENLQSQIPGQTNNIAPQVYRHLLQNRACYYEDLEMEGDMVKSWQSSADGLTWTLKLREDIRWHNKPPVNGRAFTSADVAFTIDRQVRAGDLRAAWQNIRHEEPDAHTVVLRLPERNADFVPDVLGHRYLYVVPREVEEQYGDFKTVAIGTGPFMVKEFQPGIQIIEERNPDWPEKGADGKPLSYIDGFKVLNFTDNAAEVAAFRTGQLDRNYVQGYFKTDYEALLRSNLKAKGYPDASPALWGLFFNLKQKPLDDYRVRKALQLAIDLDDIVGTLQGGAVPTGYMPASSIQYAWPSELVKEKFKPDPARARQLLAEAGYGPGQLTLKLMAGTGSNEALPVETVQQQLRSIGVQVDVKLGPSSAASSMYTTEKDWVMGWGARTPASLSPNRWMLDAVKTGGTQNYMGLSDPQVDALATAQAAELDRAKRKQIIDQIQQRLYDIMAFVPGVELVYYRLDSCRVRNLHPTDQQQNFTGIENAWIDESGC